MSRAASALLLCGAFCFWVGSLIVLFTCPPEVKAQNAIFVGAAVFFLLGSVINFGEALDGEEES